MVENTRRKIGGKKEPGKRLKPQQWLLDLLWNSLRKTPRGTQVKGDKLVIPVGRKGISSRMPPAPCPVCKGPHWKRECPPRFRFQGSDSQDNWDQRCLGVPTQAPNLLTPEEPQVLIPGGPISQFSFGHQGNFLLLKAPGLLSSWSTTVMGLSGWAKSISIIDLKNAF